jgi:hypothetical protein
MKRRTNVILDIDLVEKAKLATGESTYSGAINKALDALVRRHDFRTALEQFNDEVAQAGSDFWDRDYVEARWPEVAKKLWPREQRIADKARRR